MESEKSDDVIGYSFWGDPIYAVRRKRGRPPFEWTVENSHKVSMLLAMGWGNERIASCILNPRTGKPISVPTLKRYFRAELKVRDQARDMLFSKQLTSASTAAFTERNVGAMRFLDQLIEKNDRALAEARVSARPSPDEAKPAPKLGKKEISEQQAADAEESLFAEIEEEAKGVFRH